MIIKKIVITLPTLHQMADPSH